MSLTETELASSQKEIKVYFFIWSYASDWHDKPTLSEICDLEHKEHSFVLDGLASKMGN